MEWINVNEKLPNEQDVIEYLTIEKEDGTRKVLSVGGDHECIRYSDDLKNHVIECFDLMRIESFQYLNNDDIYIERGLDEECENLIPNKGFYIWHRYTDYECEFSEIIFIDEKVVAWMKPYIPDPYMD